MVYSSVIFAEDACGLDVDVTYGSPIRIDVGSYSVCAVEASGPDGVLVFALGVLGFGLLSGSSLAPVWNFLLGFAICAAAFAGPTSWVSNGIALWLDIIPGDMLVYAFLPALLLDESLRIKFHFFKRYLVQSLSFAFLVAIAATVLLALFMLYGLGLSGQGWGVAQAALFGSVIAATDAVSVGAILKSSGAPEHVGFMLSGESLFNDGTALVLFTIFMEKTTEVYVGGVDFEFTWMELGLIAWEIAKVVSSGAAIGLGFGMLHSGVLRLVKRRPWGHDAELTFTLAVGYICFYVAQTESLAASSGAIAVVTFGLYGAWLGRYRLSGDLQVTGQFDAVYECLMFSLNAFIFFYTGMSSFIFMIAAIHSLGPMAISSLVSSSWIGLAIYLASFVFRWVCTFVFQPLFKVAGKSLGVKEITFTTAAGLRGALSLMLLHVITQTSWAPANGVSVTPTGADLVQAQIVIWGTMFIIFTLVVNALSLAPLLKILKLTKVPEGKVHLGQTIEGIYLAVAEQAFDSLQTAMAEQSGNRLDWELVRRLQNDKEKLDPSELDSCYPRWFQRPWAGHSTRTTLTRRTAQTQPQPSTDSEDLEASASSPWEKYPNLMSASFLPTIVSGQQRATAADRKPHLSSSPLTRASVARASLSSAAASGHPMIPLPSRIASGVKSDARIRLFAGLKRHFAHSYACGHITSEALLVVNEVCDRGVFSSEEPIQIADILQAEGLGSLTVRGSEAVLGFLRNLRTCLPLHSVAPLQKPFVRLRAWKLLQMAEVISEYAAALSLTELAAFPVEIRTEIGGEMRKAQLFLRDCEVEFPELYYASLTQRAAKSLLSEKAACIKDLAHQGLLDEQEEGRLSRPIQKRILQIQNSGAHFSAPVPTKMLSSLPFFKAMSRAERNSLFERVNRYTYSPGQTAWSADISAVTEVSAADRKAEIQRLSAQAETARISKVAKKVQAKLGDMLLVFNGVLQTQGGDDDSIAYWGQGGVIGLLAALHAVAPEGDLFGSSIQATMRDVVVPGAWQSSATTTTPVARCLVVPACVFREIRQRAAAGDPLMASAEREAFRMAAIAHLHSSSEHLQQLRSNIREGVHAAETALQATSSRTLSLSVRRWPPGDGLEHSHDSSAVPSPLTECIVEDRIKDLHNRLTSARLVRLEKGEVLQHMTDTVLIGGHLSVLKTIGGAATPSLISGFQVLLAHEDSHQGASSTLTATDLGALVLVCG